MGKETRFASLCAILAAALYALCAPFSKLLLERIGPSMLAGLLYLGAGAGTGLLNAGRRIAAKAEPDARFTRAERPYVLGMVLLDIAAPILLLLGLSGTSAAAASLLNNFEIAATALLAACFFRERISGKLWIAIVLVTTACALLAIESGQALQISTSALYVLGACLCWGLENNCTRMLAEHSPFHIVTVKGLASGAGSLGIAVCLGESAGSMPGVLAALALGFVAYGLSIACYVRAQRTIGAARTSAFYAAAPFFGVLISLVIFREPPAPLFLPALILMLAGTAVISLDLKKQDAEP